MKMLQKYTMLPLLVLILLACNKQAKVMNGLEGTWKIEASTVVIMDSLGVEVSNVTENNVGQLVLYEDMDNPSKESLAYNFTFMQNDSLLYQKEGTLYSDPRKRRIIMEHVLSDSTTMSAIVWTIEKDKSKKQVWSTYGVDGELFYPTNSNNPGQASNWVYWTLELKLE
ncbi:MAG: hypothetical protein H6581_16615 [Bacteroidia bacterium]|nr:hypothetical protein [Bacteroidia bacterium]